MEKFVAKFILIENKVLFVSKREEVLSCSIKDGFLEIKNPNVLDKINLGLPIQFHNGNSLYSAPEGLIYQITEVDAGDNGQRWATVSFESDSRGAKHDVLFINEALHISNETISDFEKAIASTAEVQRFEAIFDKLFIEQMKDGHPNSFKEAYSTLWNKVVIPAIREYSKNFHNLSTCDTCSPLLTGGCDNVKECTRRKNK